MLGTKKRSAIVGAGVAGGAAAGGAAYGITRAAAPKMAKRRHKLTLDDIKKGRKASASKARAAKASYGKSIDGINRKSNVIAKEMDEINKMPRRARYPRMRAQNALLDGVEAGRGKANIKYRNTLQDLDIGNSIRRGAAKASKRKYVASLGKVKGKAGIAAAILGLTGAGVGGRAAYKGITRKKNVD